MSSILRWVTDRVSSTTNSAAETICRRIIKRFLEEPIASDAFSLELFEDWTMHLKLKRVFLNVTIVNKYIPVVIFKSIYTSGVQFDARYNLSKFDVNFDRILLELEVDEPKETEVIDEDLTSSIQQIKEQLPVEAENGWKDWFLEKVQQIFFKLSSLTVILSHLKLLVDNFDFRYEHGSATAALQSLVFQTGEKKSAEELFSARNITCQFADGAFGVSIDELRVSVSRSAVTSVLALVDKLTQSLAGCNGPASDGGVKLVLRITVNRVQIGTSNGISFVLTNLKASVGETVSVEFDRIDMSHSSTAVLSMKRKSAIEIVLPETERELTMFRQIPSGDVFNALRLTVRIPAIAVHLTKGFVDAVMDTISWFEMPKREPKRFSAQKSSSVIDIDVSDASVRVSSLECAASNIQTRLWLSQVPATSCLHAALDMQSLSVSLSETFRVFEFVNECERNVSLKVSVIDSLGHDRSLRVTAGIGVVLVRIPNDFGFVDDIISLVPKLETEETGGQLRMDLDAKLETQRIFVDYMTLKMPARALASLEETTVAITGALADPKIETEITLDFYMSNMRTDLPLRAFSLSQFHSSEFNFAHLVHCKVRKIEMMKKHVKIDSIDLRAGFCLDSIRLLLAFVMHIQYKLDSPSPRIPLPRASDSNIDHMLALTQTLTQSLNLAGIECRETRPETAKPIVFNSVEQLMSSVRFEREESLFFDEDDFSGVVESMEPSVTPAMSISITNITVDARIHGGHDYPEIWSLQELEAIPTITKCEYTNNTDFDIVTNRDEFNYLQAAATGECSVAMYEGDPSVAVRLQLALHKFDVFDNIQSSASRVLLGADEGGGALTLALDVHKTSELSLQLCLPNMCMFITQEQIKFFIDMLKSCKLPAFPSDSIVDEPPSFQLFELKPSRLHISAHFRLWLDVHLDDIDIRVPECSLFAVTGFDALIGALAEFYIAEMSRPGAIAVIGGLPVIKNLRRITAAVRDLFAFDVQKYGVAVGFGRSFAALMQIIATETLNAGANAATIAERFLSVAMRILGGKKTCDEALKTGLATLIVRSSKEGKLMKSVPAIVLAPGVLSLQKLNELMKKMRDKVNPNLKKKQKYRK